MRLQTDVKIEGRPVYTVYELTIQDILDLINSKTGESLTELAQAYLPKATTATLDDLKRLSPSEFEVLFSAFKDVNAAFFKQARTLGFDQVFGQMKDALIKDFGGIVVGSFAPGTPTPLDMDTATS